MSDEPKKHNEETEEEELTPDELEDAAGGTGPGGWNRVKNVPDPNPAP